MIYCSIHYSYFIISTVAKLNINRQNQVRTSEKISTSSQTGELRTQWISMLSKLNHVYKHWNLKILSDSELISPKNWSGMNTFRTWIIRATNAWKKLYWLAYYIRLGFSTRNEKNWEKICSAVTCGYIRNIFEKYFEIYWIPKKRYKSLYFFLNFDTINLIE